MAGPEEPQVWEGVPGVEPRGPPPPAKPGESPLKGRAGVRSDVRTRRPTYDERREHQKEYSRVKQKAKGRAKIALAQLWRILARLDEEEARDVLTSQWRSGGEAPTDLERLLFEGAAKVGLFRVPARRGGDGEQIAQRWLGAIEEGIGKAWGDTGERPIIDLRLPAIVPPRLQEQPTVTEFLEEQARLKKKREQDERRAAAAALLTGKRPPDRDAPSRQDRREPADGERDGAQGGGRRQKSGRSPGD